MTGSEMLYEFRLGADLILSGAAPGFTDAQVYSLLNRSQEYIIDELIDTKQYQFLGKMFRSGYELPAGEVVPNSGNNYSIIKLPDSSFFAYEFWKLISASIGVTRNGFSNTGVIKSTTGVFAEEIEILSPKEFERWEKYIIAGDPNSGFGVNNYVRYFKPKGTITYNSDSRTIIKVVGDYYTRFQNYANISYVSIPITISDSVDSALAIKVHRQVVDKAIDIAKTIFNIQEPQSSKT